MTRSPTDPWVAHQLREATPYGQAPTYLIRDTDRQFGPSCARVATTSGIKVLRTPYRTPQANAVCERLLGSVRRECLDHFLIFQEKHLHRLLKAYMVLYWLPGTSVRDITRFLRTDVPGSQYNEILVHPFIGECYSPENMQK